MDKELHLFYWPAQNLSAADLEEMKGNLPPLEQLAASNAKSLKRQSEIIKGRTLLRSVFRKLFNIGLPEKLVTSESGKPQSHLGYSFNMSHSKEVLALVVGNDGDLGIDVEYNNPDRNYHEIVKNFGSEREQFDLEHTEPLKQTEKFFAQWSLKESYSKATGRGLDKGLKDLEFNLEENRFSHMAQKPKCYFRYLRRGDHHLSVCHFSSEVFEIKTIEVSFNNFEIILSPFDIAIKTIT